MNVPGILSIFSMNCLMDCLISGIYFIMYKKSAHWQIILEKDRCGELMKNCNKSEIT